MNGFEEWQRLMMQKYGKMSAPGGGTSVTKINSANSYDDVAFLFTLTFSALFATQPIVEVYNSSGTLVDTPTLEGATSGSSFKYKLTQILPQGNYKLKFPEKKKDIADSSLTINERIWTNVIADGLSSDTLYILGPHAECNDWYTINYPIVTLDTKSTNLTIPWRFDFIYNELQEAGSFKILITKHDEPFVQFGSNELTGDLGLIPLDETTDAFYLSIGTATSTSAYADQRLYQRVGDTIANPITKIFDYESLATSLRHATIAYDGHNFTFINDGGDFGNNSGIIRVATTTPLARITIARYEGTYSGATAMEFGYRIVN